jgi:predicted acylesterase/phospholipase RssA
MGIPAADEPLDVEDIQETRIALAFSGGVALAVYESGVALEFFRLVNREGVYKQLPRRIGKVVVDVITGTSAGGLNGAFLANALVNGGDFNKVLALWRDQADIDKLLYGPFKANPDSVLDGDWFHRKILAALTGDPRPGFRGQALQPHVDLFITAINLPGERVDVETRDKARIPTRTHRQVFHFRYREPMPDSNEEPVNDFATTKDMQRLALAGRATASFPFAFAPVLIEESRMHGCAQHLTEDAYHIDGGVLDNRPISLALEAIAARRSDKNINRKLFFIEPDPESLQPNVVGTRARTYSAPEVVLKALVDLPGYQSLTSTLQDMEKHNQAVDERKRTLAYFNDASALFRAHGNGAASDGKRTSIEDNGAKPDEERRHGELRFIPRTERSSAFYRAIEDGYLDLRLKHDVSDELYRLLVELGEELRPQHEIEAVEGKRASEKRGNTNLEKDWPLHCHFYSIKTAILGYLDLKYVRRLYRYLVQVVRDQYPAAGAQSTGTARNGDGSTDWHRTRRCAMETLNRLKDYFYRLEAMVREQETTQEAHQKAEILQLLVHVKAALERIREQNGRIKDELSRKENLAADTSTGDGALSSAAAERRNQQEQETEWARRQKRMATFVKPLEKLLDHIRRSELMRSRHHFLDGLYQNSRRTLRNEVLNLLRQCPSLHGEPMGTQCNRDFSTAPEDGYWKLVDALDCFFLRDMMVYPLMEGDEIAAELEPIHFVRISPSDARGDGDQNKLAGKKLAHFGGFLSRTWRGNDMIWGRLDAAEIILETFLPGKEQESVREALLRGARNGILDEMRTQGMDIYSPSDGRFEHLIARQTLAAIPAPDKVRWTTRGLLTSVKILRRSIAESRAAGWLQWLVNILDYAVNGLTWLAVAIAVVCKYAWSQKHVRRLIVGLLIGVGAIVLWETRDSWLGWVQHVASWWPSLRP